MMSLTLGTARTIIKSDWSTPGYYDEAEEAIEVFWTDAFPFYEHFRRLNLKETLELACGHGRHTAQVVNGPHKFTLVDVNESNIEYCRSRFAGRTNVDFLVNDGTTLQPLESDRFTAVFCYDAMVHFEPADVISYIGEIYRVLAPRGRALLHFSNYDKAPGALYRDNPHWRNFNSAPLFKHFATRAGFEVLELQTLPWGWDLDLDAMALLRKP